MAIWQYRFTLIPKNSISNVSFNPQFDEDGLFRDDVYWLGFPTSFDFFHDVEKIIPKTKSWSNDLLLFGSEESNCLEVYRENGYVTSVSLRVDFTSDYEVFLRMIIEFIFLKGLILLDEGNNVLEINYLTIKETIEKSVQFQMFRKLN